MLSRWFSPREPRQPQRPLPVPLARRLQEIARSEVLCRDFDRLWPAFLRHGLEARQRAAVDRHLQRCPRCDALARTLAPALEPADQPLPAWLAARLRRAPQRLRRPLPFYVGDVRFAAAASWLLAMGLALLLGGPAALAERSAEVFDRPVREATRELGELGAQSQRWLGRLEGQARRYGENFSGEWQRLEQDLQNLPRPPWERGSESLTDQPPRAADGPSAEHESAN